MQTMQDSLRDLEVEGAVLPPLNYCKCEKDIAKLRADITAVASNLNRVIEAFSHYLEKKNAKI